MSKDFDTLVLGLDPGSRCTGYGLVIEKSGVLTLLEAGNIRPDSAMPFENRLGEIFDSLCRIIERTGPTEAAVEDVFTAYNSSSALKLGQARGAAIVACIHMGVSVSTYQPTLIKKSLVGAGRAAKSQVAFMVGQMLGCLPNWSEDSSDALAAAICHLNSKRMERLL